MPAHVFTRLYAQLLRLYPTRFTDEFGSEMAAVFSQALTGLDEPGAAVRTRRAKMARIFLRELWDFPHSYLAARRYRASMGAGETQTGGVFGDGELPGTWSPRPAPWPDVFLGMLPFILHGLVYLVLGIIEVFGGEKDLAFSLRVYVPALLVLMVSVSFGLLLGAMRDFPRWSFACIGMTIYFAWYSSGLWGWIPFSAPIVLALLIHWRSRRPLTQLLQGAWNDWTRLSFAIYAFTMPLLTILFMDDPEWGTVHLVWLVFDTALLAAGAAVFLRARTIPVRMLALVTPVLVFIIKGGLTGGWWRGSFWQLTGYFTMYAMFLLVPAALGVLREMRAWPAE